MNKTHIKITTLILSVIFPLSAMAQETSIVRVFAGPVLIKEMQVMHGKIAMQEQNNIKDEKAIRDLVQDNKELVSTVQEKKHEVQKNFHIFSDYQQFGTLKETLEDYSRQVEARDAQIAKQAEELARLNENLSDVTNILNQSVDASFYVGSDRAGGLAIEKKNLLAQMYESLKQKSADLTQYKSELASVKDQLMTSNARYDEVIAGQDRNKAVIVAQSGTEINALTVRLKNLQDDLSDRDARLATLESGLLAKNKEIIALNVKIEEQRVALVQKDSSIVELKSKLVAALEKGNMSLKLSNEVAELKGRLVSAIDQNVDQDKLKLTVADLNERLRLKEEIVLKHQERIDLLTEKSKLLEQKIKSEDRSEELVNLKKANEANQAEIAQLQSSIRNKDAEKESVYGMLDRFKDRLKETSDTSEEQAKSIALYRAQVEKMEDDLRISKEDIQSKQMTISSLKQDIENIKKVGEGVMQEAQAKDLSLSLVQASVEEKAKVYEALVGQLNQQIQSKEDELTAIKEKLTVAEQQIAQNGHTQELSRIQEMLKASREEIVVLGKVVESKNNEIAQLRSELAKKSELAENKNDNSAIIRDLQEGAVLAKEELEEKAKLYETVIAQMNKRIQDRADELDATKKKLLVLEDQVAQKGEPEELAKTQQIIGALREEIILINKDVESKNKEIAKLKSDLEGSVKRTKDLAKLEEYKTEALTVKDLLKTKEDQIINLQKSIDAKVKESVLVVDDIAKLKGYKQEATTVKDLLKAKEALIVTLRNEIDQSSKRSVENTAQLESALDKQKAQITKLNEELQWKQKEIARLKLQLKSGKVVSSIVPVAVKTNEVVRSEEPIKTQDPSMVLAAQLKSTQEQLQVALRKVDRTQLKEALNDARTQIVALKEELGHKQHAALQNSPEYVQMAAQVETLKKSLAELVDTNTSIQEKYNDLYVELRKAKEQINDYQMKLGFFGTDTKEPVSALVPLQ